ncbi:MAG: Ger(x)C family spore germination protein [Lutisporaceae bacterium]
MKSQFRILALIILCSLILTGCWDQKIYEQLGLILTLGIEESSDKQLLLTYVYPIIGGKVRSDVGIESAQSTIIRGVREKLAYNAPKRMEGGKIQQVLLSDSLAKTGIHDILEIFQRDATLPAVAYVVVVEGSPNELIVKGSKLEDRPRISLYLFQLIEENVKLSSIPNTKIFDFDINFFAPGLDPITPMIKLEKESVALTGCALFSDDKMVGKLDEKQTVLLLGIMGQTRNTDFVVSDPQLPSSNPIKYGIAVTLRKPKRKIDISFGEDGIPIIDISLKYECQIDEYKWNETNDPTKQNKLEKIVSKNMESYCNEVVKKIQAVNCDSVGFGNMIRAKHYEYWQRIDWREIYPQAKIKVAVQVEVVKEGIIK